MKPRHKSRTHWFNIIMAATMAAESNAGLLKPMMGEAVYGVALFVLVIGNIVLRELTTEPVGSAKQ